MVGLPARWIVPVYDWLVQSLPGKSDRPLDPVA